MKPSPWIVVDLWRQKSPSPRDKKEWGTPDLYHVGGRRLGRMIVDDMKSREWITPEVEE